LIDSIIRHKPDPYFEGQMPCMKPTPAALTPDHPDEDTSPYDNWILQGVFTVARRELSDMCREIPLARWPTDPCLGAGPDERLGRIFDAIRHAWAVRITAQPSEFVGLACPHVYGFASGVQSWQLEGAILRGLVGASAQAEQTLALHDFDGRVSIREEEPETTYLDALWVEVDDDQGQRAIFRAADPRLTTPDGDMVTLHPGDVLELAFPGAHAGSATLHAVGYYVPLRLSSSPVR
jgi:hypothetical protein